MLYSTWNERTTTWLKHTTTACLWLVETWRRRGLDTPSPPAKSFDFGGCDASRLLILRVGILMSVEFYRESPGKFDSRTLNRKTLNRWTGRNAAWLEKKTARTRSRRRLWVLLLLWLLVLLLLIITITITITIAITITITMFITLLLVLLVLLLLWIGLLIGKLSVGGLGVLHLRLRPHLTRDPLGLAWNVRKQLWQLFRA